MPPLTVETALVRHIALVKRSATSAISAMRKENPRLALLVARLTKDYLRGLEVDTLFVPSSDTHTPLAIHPSGVDEYAVYPPPRTLAQARRKGKTRVRSVIEKIGDILDA